MKNKKVDVFKMPYPANFPQTLPKLLKQSAEKYTDLPAQYTKNSEGDFQPRSFKDLFDDSKNFAAGLAKHGVKRGDRVAIISENRMEWEQAAIGLQMLGAVDTPRGADATESDLSYILSFSDCQIVIGENKSQIRKILNIAENVPTLKSLICFEEVSEEEKERAKKMKLALLDFNAVSDEGKVWRTEHPGYVEEELEKGQWDDLASIIFTSGTTGTPKGVMLSHGNYLCQLDELQERIYLNPGERALVILPVWHVFQRLCEYVVMIQGASLNYSRPIGSILLSDMQKVNPSLLPAVPRVFEAVYDGIWKKMRKTGGLVFLLFKFFLNVSLLWHKMHRRLFRRIPLYHGSWMGFWWPVLVLPWLILWPVKKLGDALVFRKVRAMLGKKFRAGVAGGGAYPEYIDKFFWACGIKIVEGYGLTETAPVVAVRPVRRPVVRTIGSPIRHTEVRIVNDDGKVIAYYNEKNKVVGAGLKGVLQVRGASVMKGYYKRDDLTAKAISSDGWLDTGDLAILTKKGEIQIRGRMKDTIVLLGGENVEPLPIETKIQTSSYVQAAVVVGQDQRFLTALILPNKEEILDFASKSGIAYKDYEHLVKTDAVRTLIRDVISENINSKNGFKAFEKVVDFGIITKPFEVGVELSAKQELKRFKVAEIYKKQIDAMYSK